jgi:hypothetical protein
VGLATGMGAQHPRFNAENTTQVAGSYGGIAFMVLAVLYILVMIALLAWPSSLYLWHRFRELPLPARSQAWMALCGLTAIALSVGTFWVSMQKGIRSLEEMG